MSENNLENLLRSKLGIPKEAKRVIIFAESSHWDPSWMMTSEEYFDRLVSKNLDAAIKELLKEPRRIYSVECMFFLRMYWERRPEQHETIRMLVNQGRLRLTSSGVTTADTILPDAEAILRDFLVGQEWLRSNGMNQKPQIAYFPDSFGHSPALPSILHAAGFTMTAITRIDGMLSPSSYHELLCKHFPLPQSTAALLMNEKRSLDFIWRGQDGAEVLCHWNAFTYGQGDLLAHRGITRVYVFPTAIPDRSDWNVARRIERFAAKLCPYSLTPYLFCPIGGDFIGPLPNLLDLLDRYNRRHYPRTGIWAINAGLDDYLDLVNCYRDMLPVLEIDPNPYWMGFYTSRPTLKKKCHDLVNNLLLAEQLILLPDNETARATATKTIQDAWWYAVVPNHHDYITGTAPDRVFLTEQLPWLDKAIENVRKTIQNLMSHKPATQYQTTSKPAKLPEWRKEDGVLEIHTPYYGIELSENKGGAILRAWDEATQEPWLSLSNDLVSYREWGGLWRMGHEFYGGKFKELHKSSERSARLEVSEREGYLEASCISVNNGETIQRQIWFHNDSPVIRLRIIGRAPRRCTMIVRFSTVLSPAQLIMDTPGGVVVRPLQKIYDPTFWPLHHFAYMRDHANGKGLALFSSTPAAISCSPNGDIELVALRNATSERAFGFLPLLGLPASGHEQSIHSFDYALLFTNAGDWRDNGIPLIARNVSWSIHDQIRKAGLHELAASIIAINHPDVFVTAVKPASCGEGIIVRLFTFTAFGEDVEVTVPNRILKAATLCDARERDLEPLEVEGQNVRLKIPGAFATIRLLP